MKNPQFNSFGPAELPRALVEGVAFQRSGVLPRHASLLVFSALGSMPSAKLVRSRASYKDISPRNRGFNAVPHIIARADRRRRVSYSRARAQLVSGRFDKVCAAAALTPPTHRLLLRDRLFCRGYQCSLHSRCPRLICGRLLHRRVRATELPPGAVHTWPFATFLGDAAVQLPWERRRN